MLYHALNLIRDPIFIHDENFKIIYANREYVNLSSFSLEEIIGRLYFEVFPIQTAPWNCCKNHSINEEINETLIYEGKAFLNRSIQVMSEDTQTTWYIHILENLNVPSQIQQMIDHLPQIMFVKDLDSEYLFCNKMYAQHLHLPSTDAIVGKNDYEFYTKELADRYRSDDKRLMQSNRTEVLIEPYPVEGEIRTVQTTKIPFHVNGKVAGIIGIAEDITEKKHYEEQIHALNIQLEQKVIERTASLKNAYDEMEAFTYSVSHDLRSPLRATDGFSQALLEDYGEQLDATAKDYLNRIRDASQKMGGLIDDLLQLSRQTRSEIVPENVDLREMAYTIISGLSDSQRQVEWIIADDMMAYGDKNLLRIVLDNIFENAWKYTSHHPSARIEFGSYFQDGEIIYYLRDDGAGFDMKYVDKLFKPFQRLHVSHEFEGNGIGLAIVDRIIKRHFGRVWIESEIEKGTTLYFVLGLSKNNINNGDHA